MRSGVVFAVLWFLVGSVGFVFCGQVVFGQDGLHVVNLDTGLEYSGVQAAIDAPETLDGHVIRVDSGVYRERVSVSKSVVLVGQDRDSTIVDGFGGTSVSVKADGAEIRDLTIRNGTFGILVDHANDVVIVNNVVSQGSYGIRLLNSRNARVTGNHVTGFSFLAIDLNSSGNSFLRDNVMESNAYSFGVDGKTLFDFDNDIDASNTVDGKRVRYLKNQRGLLIDSGVFEDVGYLGVVNSSDISVEDLDVQCNKQGILFAFVSDSSISGVSATYNWNGIYVVHSKIVSVSSCRANFNLDCGIKFFNSSRSLAMDNNVESNGWAGLGLFWSSSSTLDKNEAGFNIHDLHIAYSNFSLISRNDAVALDSSPESYSIALYYSHSNLIHHNNFANALLFSESRNGSLFTPQNVWDNGFEGNYWTDYGGHDEDFDAIGDIPYTVNDENVDNHPLMGAFHDYVVLYEGKLYSVSLVSRSVISRFEFNATSSAISFVASGQNSSEGFCRIEVSDSLIQALANERLDFLIDASQVVLVRDWSSSGNSYWYFSYRHVVGPENVDTGLWNLAVAFGVSAVLVSLGLIALYFYKRRKRQSKPQASV